MTEIPKWLISDQIITNSFKDLSIDKGFGVQKTIFFIFVLISMPFAFLLCNLRIIFFKVRFLNVHKEFKFFDFLIGNDYEVDYFYAKKFLKENDIPHEQFNQFDLSNFFNDEISIFNYQEVLFEACKDFFEVIKIHGLNAKFIIFVTSLRNMVFYVIYRTFFRYHKKRGLSDIHLISMPLSLMCAIEKENLNCNVYLHGLSVKVLPYQVPTISRILLFSNDEKDYFSRFIPSKRIYIYNSDKIINYKNVAIILLRQTLNFDKKSEDRMNVSDIEAVKTFANNNNLELYF